jgi:hypothetical protein
VNCFVIGDAVVCFTHSEDGVEPCWNDTIALLLVLSVSNARAKRNIIRNTWVNRLRSEHRMKAAFIVGRINESEHWHQLLDTENKRYKDIIMIDDFDSYDNLSYKVLAGFHWALQNCQSAKYIVKVDDDVFVNVDSLKEWLDGNSTDFDVMGPKNRNQLVMWKNSNIRSCCT